MTVTLFYLAEHYSPCYLVVPFLPDLRRGICGVFGDVFERKTGLIFA